MKLCHAIAAVVLAISGVGSAASQEATVSTTPDAKLNYTWILFLSEGPPRWFAKGEKVKVQGKSIRIVFYQGPEEMPSTYRVEEITFGTEGCCKALARARKFELRNLMVQTFGPSTDKDSPEFVFVKWLSPSSFEFKHYGRPFVLYDLDRTVIKVKRAQSGS